MTAIITVRIQCDNACGNFRVMETDSRTTARRMLSNIGWRVILKHSGTSGGTSYGDLCPSCPQGYFVSPGRHKPDISADALIGDTIPKRKR